MSLQDYIEKKPVLQSERLVLRPLVKEDTADLKEWLGDKSIYKYWGKGPSKSDKNPELLFQGKDNKPVKSFHWGIVHREDNKAIGELWIYLIENNRMAKVAYRLSPKYHERNLMTEALSAAVEFCFSSTELQRLWTDVHIDNIPSIKTLENAGFIREGLIRQGKLVSTYCDYYIYGLLKYEWCIKNN